MHSPFRVRAPLLALLMMLPVPVLASCSRSEGPAQTDPKLGGSVDGARAKQLVAQGAVLLDVRSPAEFAAGHPSPAINIPVDELAARKAEIPKDKPIVTYCSAGVRSARAAKLLRQDGRTAHDMGTVSAWPSE